jgi:hypothetical protein
MGVLGLIAAPWDFLREGGQIFLMGSGDFSVFSQLLLGFALGIERIERGYARVD